MNELLLHYSRLAQQQQSVLDTNLPDVGTGHVETSCCGAAQFFIQADNEEKIIDIRYKVIGDNTVFACSAYIAEQCAQKTLTQAFQLTEQQVASALGLNFKQVRKANTPLRALRIAIATCRTKLRRYYVDT